MIIVLLDSKNNHAFLTQALEQQALPVLFFQSVVELQQWLELNPEPAGMIIDSATSIYQDFLIHFTLRYPETPILPLKQQINEQLNLRLKAFFNRLSHSGKSTILGKILLVDDSRTVQLKYRKILEKDGFTVEIADNAKQGLEKALSQKYDLAIIDYFMPGDTGAQLCQQLQKYDETYDLVCAILTAQYKESVVDECLNSGARECMFKNESSDLFLTRVRALIRGVERKRQVEKERARLIGLLYSVAEGVYGVSSEGEIQFINPATLKLLGQSMVNLMGRFPHDCIHPTDNIGQQTSFEHCFLQQAYLLGDELRDWRTLFQRSDGSLFPVECSVTLLGNRGNNQGSVVVFRDISEQLRLENNWQWQLNHDHLTGLLNRNAFEEILNRELSRIKRSHENALVLFIDLDNFKLVNDELGHAAGDQLLKELSKSLSDIARDTDYVGRLAGDEFVMLLTSVTQSEITIIGDKYRNLLENSTLYWDGKKHVVTGSIGLSIIDENSKSVGEVIAQADQACQQAKQKGKNQWYLFESSDNIQTEQGNWFQRLTDAIENQQYTLLQQPIYSAQNREQQVGINCLLRLKEGSSLISPAIFMANAKRFGVIKSIDKLVINELADYCAQNTSQSKGWFTLSLSMESIADPLFQKEALKIWSNSKLQPQQLRFEIGEEELFKFPEWHKHLATLRESGFGIVISHFGMNSHSLLSLPQLPVDAIKLDTSLTRELSTSIPRSYLIDAIVKTARKSKVDVIATHIEKPSDLELLLARGIDHIQGFYLGKPSQL